MFYLLYNKRQGIVIATLWGGFASPPLFPDENGGENLGGKNMSNCGNCNGKDKNTPENVPYLVHESENLNTETDRQ